MTTIRSGHPILLALALLASACTGGKDDKGGSESPVTSAVVSPSPDNLKAFQAAGGLTPLGAAFLAMTKLEVTSPEKNLYHFTLSFPTKTTADITFRVTPGQKYTPTADELANAPRERIYGAKVSHTVEGQIHHFKLEYFLPDGVLPLALRNRGTSPRVLPADFRVRHRALRMRPIAQEGGSESGASVIVEATIKEFIDEFVSTIEEGVLQGVFGEKVAEGAPASAANSAFSDVLEALEIRAEYIESMQEIAELEQMVENPSNALTQKAYTEDPGLKQRLVDEIADLKSEVQNNAALQFVNKEISAGIGLTKVPALAVGVSAIAEWNSKTLKQVIKERIKNLRRQVSTGFLNNRGPKTQPPATVIPRTPGGGPTPGPTIPPGSWLCTYSGTIVKPWTDNGTITINDAGSFLFTVKPDGSIEGQGGGRTTLHGVSGGTTADGGGGYTFKVGGKTRRYLDLQNTPEGSTPAEFQMTVTNPDGTTLKMPHGNGPFLFSGQGLKLEHGSTANYHLAQGGMTDNRVMTITNKN